MEVINLPLYNIAVPIEVSLILLLAPYLVLFVFRSAKVYYYTRATVKYRVDLENSLNWPLGPGKVLRRSSDDPQAAYAEYAACIDDLIYSPTVQMLDGFKHHQNVSRLDHSLNVSFTSYSLCKVLGWDYRSAARGGLLHDLFLYDWRTTTLEEGRHGFAHPQIALNNASEEFSLNSLEKDIILKHMFPLTWQPPGYRESIMVCLVDKCCALQEIFIFGISARSYMKGRHVSYLELLQDGIV
jgi:uncharacterized protein